MSNNQQIIFIDRIETFNRESLAFALMFIGVGLWLSTWLLVLGDWMFNSGGLTLLASGTFVSLLGSFLYAMARTGRIERGTKVASEE